MSPEQQQGTPLTAASDVYSLGLIIYTLAAGFERLNPEMPGDLSGEYPDWFDPWLEKALAENPSARYPDARAMLAATPFPQDRPATSRVPCPPAKRRSLSWARAFLIAAAVLPLAYFIFPPAVQDELLTIATIASRQSTRFLAAPTRPQLPPWQLILLSDAAGEPDQTDLTRAALRRCNLETSHLLTAVQAIAVANPALAPDVAAALERMEPTAPAPTPLPVATPEPAPEPPTSVAPKPPQPLVVTPPQRPTTLPDPVAPHPPPPSSRRGTPSTRPISPPMSANNSSCAFSPTTRPRSPRACRPMPRFPNGKHSSP